MVSRTLFLISRRDGIAIAVECRDLFRVKGSVSASASDVTGGDESGRRV